MRNADYLTHYTDQNDLETATTVAEELRSQAATLSSHSEGNIAVKGTNTNDNAAAGYVGELIEAEVTSASPASLTSAVAANITSISLTAGDWDVAATGAFNTNALTNWTALLICVNTTSATATFANGRFWNWNKAASVDGASTMGGFGTGVTRFSLASTTTIYLIARGTFSAGTLEAFGKIRARRVR